MSPFSSSQEILLDGILYDGREVIFSAVMYSGLWRMLDAFVIYEQAAGFALYIVLSCAGGIEDGFLPGNRKIRESTQNAIDL